MRVTRVGETTKKIVYCFVTVAIGRGTHTAVSLFWSPFLKVGGFAAGCVRNFMPMGLGIDVERR